jgi:homoserine dehydrogenase
MPASSLRSPLRVGLLGAGTVGAAVARAFLETPERLAPFDGSSLVLAGVAVRDPARAIAAGIPEALLTDAPAHLVASPEVDIVVELIGGDEPARTLIAAALAAGKPVVTANKHVIAHHGPALEALARSSGSPLRFEAAVAAGVPILGLLATDLAANRVERVRGIVNGTTNFILSAMGERRRSYEGVLADAQRAGYAEADPAGDVEGDDALNKLVILARLAFGSWLEPDSIERRPATGLGLGRAGITGVTGEEVAAAAVHGLRLKLLVDGRRLAEAGGGSRAGADTEAIQARVQPVAVPADSGLGRTSGVVNRIELDATPLGRLELNGPGAGGGPTSSAVLADLIAIARGGGSTWAGLAPAGERASAAIPIDDLEARRWFFQSLLPDQLIRDQLDLEAAGSDGFVTTAQPLDEVRAALAALGIEATLYPIEDVA